jgi:hypothetical protein
MMRDNIQKAGLSDMGIKKFSAALMTVAALFTGGAAQANSLMIGDEVTCGIGDPYGIIYSCAPNGLMIGNIPAVADVIQPSGPLLRAFISDGTLFVSRFTYEGSTDIGAPVMLQLGSLMAMPGYQLSGAMLMGGNSPLTQNSISMAGSDMLQISLEGEWQEGNFAQIDLQFIQGNQPPAVPLPAGLPLLLAGIGAFAFLRRRNA